VNRDEGPLIFLTSMIDCLLRHLAANTSYHDNSDVAET